MNILEKRSSLQTEPQEQSESAADRVADVFVFGGFLVVSILALAAVAVATPLVLAISALAGLFARNSDGNGWRPAGA